MAKTCGPECTSECNSIKFLKTVLVENEKI